MGEGPVPAPVKARLEKPQPIGRVRRTFWQQCWIGLVLAGMSTMRMLQLAKVIDNAVPVFYL